MRRKSARTSGKQSPEKAKQLDSPARKTRRTSKRRKKSTSESENSEDDQEVIQTTEKEALPAESENISVDPENNGDTVDKESDVQEETMEKHEKKIRLKRNNRSSTAIDGNETAHQEERRRSRRRGSPKTEERTHREDDDDDRKGKGKSKGKTKSAKIEKSQPPDESETHNESEISTNAQVTPQSPHIVNTNLMVDNDEVHVAEKSAEDNKSSEVEHTEGAVDDAGNTDAKDEIDSETHHVESKQTTDENITKTAIESENVEEETVTEVLQSNESKNDEEVNYSDNSNIKQDESPVNNKETEVEEAAVNESEQVPADVETTETMEEVTDEVATTENIETETAQTEVNEEVVKSDEGFTGFHKDKSETIAEKQTVDEPMDISTDISFTLKLDCSSIVITEAEDSTVGNLPESNVTEIKAPQEENTTITKPHERVRAKSTTSRKVTIRRNSNVDSEPTIRGKKWGSAATFLSRFTPVKIDTDIIKSIYTDVQLLDESEVKLDIEIKDRRRSTTDSKDRKRLERLSSNESDSRKRDSEEKEQEEDNANIIAMNRKISIVDDSASKLKPPPSPAKNPTSSVLFITNLVRPFTLKQLRELLERTGKIKENSFWTDRIKSKCYVEYEKLEDAEATRNALHGVHWPIGNGKKLMIDYAKEEDLENARNPPVTPPIPEPPVKVEKENQEPIKKLQEEEEERNREKLKEKRRHEHVREWDVGKTETHGRGRSRSRSRDRSDKRRHSRHSPSPFEDYLTRKQKKAEEQVPQKLMDDLFQKTKTTPSIYWQPLSPEEIATKQQQRLERMAEHKRRMEESSRGGRAEFGRGGPYRRRYD